MMEHCMLRTQSLAGQGTLETSYPQQIAQGAALHTQDLLSGRAGNIWKKASALGGEEGALSSAAGEMV